MPLFYQKNIHDHCRLAIWKIEENEDFFLQHVPLQRNITHPNKRLQHLAGRYLLSYLFPDFPCDDVRIADTRKPFLQNEQYHFSISHCGNFAAALVSSTERVGIDIEMITGKLVKIKHKFLHADELRFVNSQPESSQLQLLSILWSAKEAMYKWFGHGEVDFREMMRTQPFQFAQQGYIDAAFIHSRLQQKLTVHYQLMNHVTLAYVTSK